MSVTLPTGSSLRRVAEIVRNAIRFGADPLGPTPLREDPPKPSRSKGVLPTDADVVELFALLRERRVPYLLVGGIALLRNVEGRNTEDIGLLMSLPSLEQLPEVQVEDRNEFFARGRFRGVRVDVLLTTNAVFAETQERFHTLQRFAEQEVPVATPEGLILLKLYALPSLYRQGRFDRVTVFEGDIACLMQRHRPNLDPLFRLLVAHLAPGDVQELKGIVRDIEARIARFEGLQGPQVA